MAQEIDALTLLVDSDLVHENCAELAGKNSGNNVQSERLENAFQLFGLTIEVGANCDGDRGRLVNLEGRGAELRQQNAVRPHAEEVEIEALCR